MKLMDIVTRSWLITYGVYVANSQCERGYFYQPDGWGLKIALDYCQNWDANYIVSCSDDGTYLEITNYTDVNCANPDTTTVYIHYRPTYTSPIDGNTYWDPEFECTGDITGCKTEEEGVTGWAIYSSSNTALTSCSGATFDDFDVFEGGLVVLDDECFADIDDRNTTEESVQYRSLTCDGGSDGNLTGTFSSNSDCSGGVGGAVLSGGCSDGGNVTYTYIIGCLNVTEEEDTASETTTTTATS